MSNAETTEALHKLLAVAFTLQYMTSEEIGGSKFALSLGLQEVAKRVGDAHGMDWSALVEGALGEIVGAANEVDAAAVAGRAILKAMGRM